MLKIKVFVNDPCGLTWKRLHEIMPRLGARYELEVEEISRSREEYQSEAYRAAGLPAAPAVMVEDEIAGQGPGISEAGLEAAIRRHLGLPPLEPWNLIAIIGGEEMLKVRFFLNEPNGKPWKHFLEMMPRLGQKYHFECEVISKPNAEYQTDEYFELDLPTAPAVMVGEEIVVEGSDVEEHRLETVICQHLGLPEPQPPKKGFLGRIFGR